MQSTETEYHAIGYPAKKNLESVQNNKNISQDEYNVKLTKERYKLLHGNLTGIIKNEKMNEKKIKNEFFF
jgi:hypothetical protein